MKFGVIFCFWLGFLEFWCRELFNYELFNYELRILGVLGQDFYHEGHEGREEKIEKY